MGSGTNRLRIVWICHFLNQAIKEKLGININENEFAPWITLGIEEIKKRNDIELHIIAPFFKILKNHKFSERNIFYHCIKVGIPFMKKAWPTFFKFDLWNNYFLFNFQVKRLVKRINPDLIDLRGAENAYYSSSILDINGYPILVTIQGFVSLYKYNNKIGREKRKRIQIEDRILRKLKNFGVEADFMEKYIKTLNPEAKIFFYHIPYAKTNVKIDVPKEYDLVFFANISKMKGIEDLIKAVAIVKKQKSNIILCIIGRVSETYFNYLKDLIANLNLTANIVFRGFLPTQKELHEEVVKARISVLPTYNDTIPGTIVESMLLGIPVITYNVGGNPDINKYEENIILVDMGNVERLAYEITKLLSNTERQKELAYRARKYATYEFDNTNSVNELVKTYKKIIKQYNNIN